MLLAVALCLSTNLFCDEILRYIQMYNEMSGVFFYIDEIIYRQYIILIHGINM